jgi:hypothetical protein
VSKQHRNPVAWLAAIAVPVLLVAVVALQRGIDSSRGTLEKQGDELLV